MIKRIIEDIKKIKGVRTAFPVDDRIVVDLEEECDILAHNADIIMSGTCGKCGGNIENYK